MKDGLTVLADKYKCDKGSMKHLYTEIYHKYLHFMRNDKFNMLEIGFGEGASAKMWVEYFPNAVIYCADIREELPQDELLSKYVDEGRFKFFSADQSNVEQMSKVVEEGPFRIIIDDGSHVTEDMQCSFGQLFPHLLSGELYIIEDMNCKRGHNPRFRAETVKMVEILKRYEYNGVFDSEILTDAQLVYLNAYIKSVDMYSDKIVFIRKV